MERVRILATPRVEVNITCDVGDQRTHDKILVEETMSGAWVGGRDSAGQRVGVFEEVLDALHECRLVDCGMAGRIGDV